MAFNFKQLYRTKFQINKVMKARIVCIILLSLSFACKDEDVFKEVTPVPEDIFNIDLCPTLVSNVVSLFPESKNNQDKYNPLFTSGSQQRIVLTKDTDVYATFVTEGASLGNVLGYYVYNSNSVPGSPDDIEKQLIFPNIHSSILTPGDTRKLGNTKLKAGSVVGFFLIVGGYRNGGVYFKRPTSYTDVAWNPNQLQQHVLFEESECGSIVLGFEDKESATSDKDYNDIIFMVSDNINNTKTTSFDVQNVVSLSK